MSLDDSSSIGAATAVELSPSHSSPETEESSVIIRKVEGGVHHAFVPTLLRASRERIAGATRTELKDGSSEITARASRTKLVAALKSIKGIALAEE